MMMVVFLSLTITSCQKDPDFDELSTEFVTYTDYDKSVNFSSFSTFYISDTIKVLFFNMLICSPPIYCLNIFWLYTFSLSCKYNICFLCHFRHILQFLFCLFVHSAHFLRLIPSFLFFCHFSPFVFLKFKKIKRLLWICSVFSCIFV